jgi:protein-disulfide isomerase
MLNKRVVMDVLRAAAVLVIAAMVSGAAGALVVQRVWKTPNEAVALRAVADWQRYAVGGELMGSPAAPVTIIAFSDFQCQFCAQLHWALEDVRRSYPDDVRIVYRHYPIASTHPFATAAAQAAVCAGAQSAFEAMAGILFRHQNELGQVPWSTFARQAGVRDTAAFERCFRDPATAGRIRADRRLGHELGVRGTPTFIVAGRVIGGMPPPHVIDSLISSELRSR